MRRRSSGFEDWTGAVPDAGEPQPADRGTEPPPTKMIAVPEFPCRRGLRPPIPDFNLVPRGAAFRGLGASPDGFGPPIVVDAAVDPASRPGLPRSRLSPVVVPAPARGPAESGRGPGRESGWARKTARS